MKICHRDFTSHQPNAVFFVRTTAHVKYNSAWANFWVHFRDFDVGKFFFAVNVKNSHQMQKVDYIEKQRFFVCGCIPFGPRTELGTNRMRKKRTAVHQNYYPDVTIPGCSHAFWEGVS